MANAPDNSTYLLVSEDTENLPNSRVLRGGTGIALQDNGPTQSYTIQPLGNLSTIYNYNQNGYIAYDVGNQAFIGRSFSGGNTISITNPNGVDGQTVFDVVDNTSTQRVNVQIGSVFASNRSSLNFIAGENINISVADDVSTNSARITISAEGAGDGTVTSVGASTSSNGLTITGSPVTTSGVINFELDPDLQALSVLGGNGLMVKEGSGNFTTRSVIAGDSLNIQVTNGDGVSADPTVELNPHITVERVTITDAPVSSNDAVPKEYVDAIAAGFTFKDPCLVVSVDNLDADYDNGTSGVGATLTNSGGFTDLTIDGVVVPLNARVLVVGQTISSQNGIYTCTNQGTALVAWVLTRATDYDQASEILPGNLIPIQEGDVYFQSSWLQTHTVTTVGTDPITFTQFTFGPSAYLEIVNNLSDLENFAQARANLGLTNVAIQNVVPNEVLIGGDSDNIVSLELDNGQFLIGETGSSPVAANLTPGTGITILNNPGAVTISQAVIPGLVAGDYTNANVTVDNTGRVTEISNGDSGTVTEIVAGAGLSGGIITTTGTIAIADIEGLLPGSYTNSNVTVNQKGQITAITNGAGEGTGTVTSITAGSNLTGGTITSSGTIALNPVVTNLTSVQTETIYLNVTVLS